MPLNSTSLPRRVNPTGSRPNPAVSAPATEISEVPAPVPSVTQRPVSRFGVFTSEQDLAAKHEEVFRQKAEIKFVGVDIRDRELGGAGGSPIGHPQVDSVVLQSKELNNTLLPKTVKSSGSKLDP